MNNMEACIPSEIYVRIMKYLLDKFPLGTRIDTWKEIHRNGQRWVTGIRVLEPNDWAMKTESMISMEHSLVELAFRLTRPSEDFPPPLTLDEFYKIYYGGSNEQKNETAD